MQAAHEDAGGAAAEIQRRVLRPEQADELVIDDFDDLLAGLDALDDFLAERLLAHAIDEVAGDLEIDVCLEQRHAHLAQGIAHVGLGDFAEAAKVLENFLQLVGQAVEHRGRTYAGTKPTPREDAWGRKY